MDTWDFPNTYGPRTLEKIYAEDCVTTWRNDSLDKIGRGWRGTFNTKCILGDHTSTSPMHTPFFPTLTPQTSERQMKHWAEKKHREGKRIFPCAHRSEVCMLKLEPLWTARWLKQRHCVYELLTIYTSVSSPARKHLQIEHFMQKKVLGIFQSAKSQTQEIQSWEAPAVFGDY